MKTSSDITAKNADFFTKYPSQKFPKGHILVSADESPEHVFYLVSGKVRKYSLSYRGEEIVVSIFKPPAFFPMSWALTKSPNTFYYKTMEPTEVRMVPIEDTIMYLKTNPEVMFDLLSRLYKATDDVFERLVRLMSGTAQSRVVYELLIESRRGGQKQDDGSILLSSSPLDLTDRTGLSQGAISRELHKLQDKKLVYIDGKAISVLDQSGLEQLISTEP